ncbi:MAG: hypothetical protein H7328_04755 [Bdellovibrio sp.]|nr:hypothetical protein [Bdellovibrio sp.]
MKLPFKPRFLNNQTGQILVEYLLLMVIAIACATILTKSLVGRGSEGSKSGQGMIIKQWDRILHVIGNDIPDCAKQTSFGTPNCP